MGQTKQVQPKYTDGRTKQSFKDETDINKIMQRAQKTGTISHLAKYQGVYGDFAEFDFNEQQIKLAQGREVFDALPSELRKEFNQSPADFFEYVNDPANADDLKTKLPGLAAPGRQNLDVKGNQPADSLKAAAAAEQPIPPGSAPAAPETPPKGSEEPSLPPE